MKEQLKPSTQKKKKLTKRKTSTKRKGRKNKRTKKKKEQQNGGKGWTKRWWKRKRKQNEPKKTVDKPDDVVGRVHRNKINQELFLFLNHLILIKKIVLILKMFHLNYGK